MALFQTSVLHKYLRELNQEKVNKAWDVFQPHFQNSEIQTNIRQSKEEQYQEGFLRDLFVKVLGYTLNPVSGFNLTTELKNIKNAKKTDGAILKDGKALAVIELKGTDTTDLSKVESQAFGYKNNQPDCKYVITSNFEKLRFYIDNAVDHEDFNLFTLTRERFNLLWLCLSADYLLNNLPKKIKDESHSEEEEITKQLYKDYSLFRSEIFENIQRNNPEYDKLTLFKKTQKLLDRFLFIFFAEDRLLLPPNSIREIVKQWKTLKDLDAYVPLFNRFKMYFNYMNNGYKGKTHDIFAYNGGLFSSDDILENIVIDDDLLFKHTRILSNYDFQSEVSVNILGHIFEHSLNEIEEIQAEIEEGSIPETKISRRKKDGVFYTPKYITKYIVDNTVKTLCEDKKSDFDIQEAEYEKKRKGRQTKTIHSLIDKLDAYRNWLLDLKICDPACGSGAFLNQALEFLIAEHEYIDELQNKLLGNFIPFTNIENSILEKNLYGVDINEESVEIAKLSLWLRTAEKGRKLTSLNDNIKCGNSLIDDPAVAGDKAFNWYESFPQVFEPKENLAYHIVLTTHNSRTSHRMIEHNIKKGEPLELTLGEEIALTEIIGDIITENGYHCIAYNICKDHVHLIMVCEGEELTGIIQKVKSISSKEFHRLDISRVHSDPREHAPLSDKNTTREHVPLDEIIPLGEIVPLDEMGTHKKKGKTYTPLWSQKFFYADLQNWEVASLSHRPGYLFDDDRLENAIVYVRTNREKHGLPDSTELRKLIDSFTEEVDVAFRPEYKGGFDVVIGNPPYVRAELIGEYLDYFSRKYQVFNSSIDLFAYFYELGSKLIKADEGRMGYISNTFDKTTAGKSLRDYLASQTTIHQYIDFTEVQVFQGATTYPVIIILDRGKPDQNQFTYVKIPKNKQSNTIDILNEKPIEVLQESLGTGSWAFLPKQKAFLLNRISNSPNIRQIYGKCYYGVKTGLNEAFIVEKSLPASDHVKYIYEGREIKKWHTPDPVQSLIIFESNWTRENYGNVLSENQYFEKLTRDYPHLINHLKHYESKAKKRYDKGEFWWELRNCAYYDLFEKPKIIFPNLQNENKFSLDLDGVYINAPAVFLPIANKTVLCILNSKIVWEFLKSICVIRSGGYIEVKPQYFEQIPIPELKNEETFEQKADLIINYTRDHQKLLASFTDLLQNKFDIENLSKKLQNWHELSFGAFLQELKRKKVNLSLSEEAEWMDYFQGQKAKALSIQTEITHIDREIDAMVYELYELTDEEIALVEEG